MRVWQKLDGHRRPRGGLLSEALRCPAADPTVPRGVRVRLGLLLALPIDLIPGPVPLLGCADDGFASLTGPHRHAR